MKSQINIKITIERIMVHLLKTHYQKMHLVSTNVYLYILIVFIQLVTHSVVPTNDALTNSSPAGDISCYQLPCTVAPALQLAYWMPLTSGDQLTRKFLTL